jgi:hypothetical protein
MGGRDVGPDERDPRLPLPPRSGRVRTLILTLLLLTAPLTLDACGTALTFSGSSEDPNDVMAPRPFGGTRLDLRAVSLFATTEFPWPLAALPFALDLPLSVAADLLTLPVTIAIDLTRGEQPATPAGPEPARK